MIELPLPPRTFTTRHVRCISCEELFAVAEEFFEENQRRAGGREDANGGDRRRLSPDYTAFTWLRARDRRQQQPVQAQNRAAAQVQAQANEDARDNYVNCPRCGADNRNWLQILTRPDAPNRLLVNYFRNDPIQAFIFLISPIFVFLGFIAIGFLLAVQPDRPLDDFIWPLIAALLFAGFTTAILLFPQQLFNRVTPVVPLLYGVLFSLGLAFCAFLLAYDRWPDDVLIRAAPLAVSTAAVGFLSTTRLTAEWRIALQQHRLQRWLPGQTMPQWRTRPFRIAARTLVNWTITLPLFLFFLLPFLINAIAGAAEPQANPPLGELRAYRTDVENWRAAQGNDVSGTADSASLVVLTAVSGYLDATNAQRRTESQVTTLQQLLASQQELLPSTLASPNQSVADALTVYLGRLAAAEDAPLVPGGFPWGFLIVWIGIVSLSGGMSSGAALGTVMSFARTVDGQLPPPIFYSVANMTRIVAWEAKHALEVRGNMEHVQWMGVQRNEQGGINLIGLHRQVRTHNADGRPIEDLLPAQKYMVRTDRNGRILEAGITDMRVRPTVNAPEVVMAPLERVRMHR